MDLNEIKAYLDTNKDNEEVKSYINGFTTVDRVESYLNTEEGRKALQPKLDLYHGKGLETWKANNLDKIYQERFAKENPGVTPEQLKYQELENKFNLAEKGRLKETLTNKAFKLAQEKKLPVELIDYLIGDDETGTVNNVESMSAIFAKRDETLKTEWLKGNTHIPPGGQGSGEGESIGMKLALKAQEAQKQASTTKNYFE